MIKWVAILDKEEFLSYRSFYFNVQKLFSIANDFDTARALLRENLNHLIAEINKFRDKKLQEEKVSDERLKEVANWCSKSGFSNVTAPIPVSLFRKVRHLPAEFDAYHLTITGMNKGEFVEPPMYQRASNEDDYFDLVVKRQVAATVMAEVIKILKPDVINTDNPNLYWKQIKNAADSIHKEEYTPLLFVASKNEPSWLFDWSRGMYDEKASLPNGLRFYYDKEKKSDYYIGNLNEISVFRAPIPSGSSYLIPEEAFKMISFTMFDDEVFTQVNWEPVDSEEISIDLKISWRFNLDLKNCRCWQIRYASER